MIRKLCVLRVFARKYFYILLMLIRKCTPENQIPQFGTHTITMIHVFVMMQHVVVLHFQPEFTFDIKMMDGVMRHVVEKISDKKTNEKWRDIQWSEHHFKQEIKQCRQRNTYCWHHDQAFAVTWIIVVHTMKNKMHPLAPF